MIASNILADSLRLRADGWCREHAILLAWGHHTGGMPVDALRTLADILGISAIVL